MTTRPKQITLYTVRLDIDVDDAAFLSELKRTHKTKIDSRTWAKGRGALAELALNGRAIKDMFAQVLCVQNPMYIVLELVLPSNSQCAERAVQAANQSAGKGYDTKNTEANTSRKVALLHGLREAMKVGGAEAKAAKAAARSGAGMAAGGGGSAAGAPAAMEVEAAVESPGGVGGWGVLRVGARRAAAAAAAAAAAEAAVAALVRAAVNAAAGAAAAAALV